MKWNNFIDNQMLTTTQVQCKVVIDSIVRGEIYKSSYYVENKTERKQKLSDLKFELLVLEKRVKDSIKSIDNELTYIEEFEVTK